MFKFLKEKLKGAISKFTKKVEIEAKVEEPVKEGIEQKEEVPKREIKEISAENSDTVVSFGEQLSAFIISEAIKNRDVSCEFVDSRKIIKTDNNFGEANVDIESSYKLISNYLKSKKTLYVMGGFIGSTHEGATTTLGRGGSDYTASLVGAALDASVVEIWTDVDGLMTADPRVAKNAVTIPQISYEEAEKMANAGAKVIHPKTMQPAREKSIPIYIKNTFNPKGNYTKICQK